MIFEVHDGRGLITNTRTIIEEALEEEIGASPIDITHLYQWMCSKAFGRVTDLYVYIPETNRIHIYELLYSKVSGIIENYMYNIYMGMNKYKLLKPSSWHSAWNIILADKNIMVIECERII